MPIFSKSKCALFLSDDGVSIYKASSNKIELVDSFSWGSDNFEKNIADILKNKGVGKSVIFINDMVEQHYRKERIPKTNILDQANIINRRVTSTFPTYPLRSAIKLKEKAPPVEGQRNAEIYLLAAMPMTETLSKVVSVVQSANLKISGFCLLPLEATSMVLSLSKKMSKIGLGGGTDWTIFAGQHRGDGLRQVVIKNGELALTRLTPISSHSSDPDVWANDVANELRGTMSYLSRFGFTSNDTLNVIVLGDDWATSKLQSKIDFDCDLNTVSVDAAANILGLNLGRQPDTHFVDALHIASIAKKKTLLMSLSNSRINASNKPILMAEAASIALFCLAAYFGFECFNKYSAISSYSSQIDIANQEQMSLKQQRDLGVEQKNKIGLDFMLVDRATTAFQSLDSDLMLPLPAFKKMGDAMGADLHVKTITIKPTVVVASLNNAQEAADDGSVAGDELVKKDSVPKSYDVVLSFLFPSNLDPNLGVQIIADYEGKLKKSFPESSVTVIKQIADLSYTGNFVGSASSQQNQNPENATYEAQIMIRGPLQ